MFAAMTPPTYAGAPQSLANPVTFFWYCGVYPAMVMKYFDANFGASTLKMGPKAALTPTTKLFSGASVLTASVRCASVALFSSVDVSLMFGSAVVAATMPW